MSLAENQPETRRDGDWYGRFAYGGLVTSGWRDGVGYFRRIGLSALYWESLRCRWFLVFCEFEEHCPLGCSGLTGNAPKRWYLERVRDIP
jgi:hypothetical protein